MDRLLTLEVFTAVVDHGSFVAAARALDLSPASVTEHIQALEKRLKTKLLNRTTRRIALTEEGAAYFEHCKQTLARMEEADAMLAAQRTSPKGTLRIQGPQVLVNGILLPRMSKFLERYPELSIEFSISAAMPDLVQQNLDLAILINPDPSPGVIFRPIGLCPVRTFASPAYLRKRGTPKHPDELADAQRDRRAHIAGRLPVDLPLPAGRPHDLAQLSEPHERRPGRRPGARRAGRRRHRPVVPLRGRAPHRGGKAGSGAARTGNGAARRSARYTCPTGFFRRRFRCSWTS